jgi:hypothetical protein
MRTAPQICYTLEEAAQALYLSETVLVRLSQFFRIPASAYEEVGAMSFKDDPLLYEADLNFFREVKQRLIAGETLEAVKKSPPRLSYVFPQPQTQPEQKKDESVSWATQPSRKGTPLANSLAALNQSSQILQKGLVEETLPNNSLLSPQVGLNEIQDNGDLLSKTADRRFRQYRKSLRKVFQTLLSNLHREEGSSSIEDFELLGVPEPPSKSNHPEETDVEPLSAQASHSTSELHIDPVSDDDRANTLASLPPQAQTVQPMRHETSNVTSISLSYPFRSQATSSYEERHLNARLSQVARQLKTQALQRNADSDS